MADCILNDRTCFFDNNSCQHCGWNAEEADHRKKLLTEMGLTLCKDGLQRLIITRDQNKKPEE